MCRERQSRGKRRVTYECLGVATKGNEVAAPFWYCRTSWISLGSRILVLATVVRNSSESMSGNRIIQRTSPRTRLLFSPVTWKRNRNAIDQRGTRPNPRGSFQPKTGCVMRYVLKGAAWVGESTLVRDPVRTSPTGAEGLGSCSRLYLHLSPHALPPRPSDAADKHVDLVRLQGVSSHQLLERVHGNVREGV